MQLVFIYNAKSGYINGLIDFVHKNVSPETYECNLCALTYNNLGMKKNWKKFIESLNIETKFLHKDELEGKFKELKDISLPAVVYQNAKSNFDLLISSDEMNNLKQLADLEILLKSKLQNV